jgi:hypothetical protein
MLRLEITETVYMESPQLLLDAVRKGFVQWAFSSKWTTSAADIPP